MWSIRYRPIREREGNQYATTAALSLPPQAWCRDRCCRGSLLLSGPPCSLSAGGRPETNTELKVVHLQHCHCTPLHRCSRIRPGLGCVCFFFLDESHYIDQYLILSFSPDLPASSLQYQCGSVDYLCSPRLVKKGPTPRPCHDRPAIKPRPQPSTSPRPPTTQKPQGKTL